MSTDAAAVDDRDVFLRLVAAGRVVVDRAKRQRRSGDLRRGHAGQAVEELLPLGEKILLHAGDRLRRRFVRHAGGQAPAVAIDECIGADLGDQLVEAVGHVAVFDLAARRSVELIDQRSHATAIHLVEFGSRDQAIDQMIAAHVDVEPVVPDQIVVEVVFRRIPLVAEAEVHVPRQQRPELGVVRIAVEIVVLLAVVAVGDQVWTAK